MKILKEGKWNVKWETKIACPTCSAELLAEERDLSSSWDGSKKTTKYSVACPECGESIAVPVKEIAPRLVAKLRCYAPSYSDW